MVKQVGKSNTKRDSQRKALPPGKRKAKKSKKTYYETRKNRSDRKGSRL